MLLKNNSKESVVATAQQQGNASTVLQCLLGNNNKLMAPEIALLASSFLL